MNIVGGLVEWQTHKRYSRRRISLMLWTWSNLGKNNRMLTKQHYSMGRDFWFVGEISIPHDPMVSWWLLSLKICYFAFENKAFKSPKMKWIIFYPPIFAPTQQRGASELFLWPGLGWTTLLVCRFPARTQGPFTMVHGGGSGVEEYGFSIMMKKNIGVRVCFLLGTNLLP